MLALKGNARAFLATSSGAFAVAPLTQDLSPIQVTRLRHHSSEAYLMWQHFGASFVRQLFENGVVTGARAARSRRDSHITSQTTELTLSDCA